MLGVWKRDTHFLLLAASAYAVFFLVLQTAFAIYET